MSKLAKLMRKRESLKTRFASFNTFVNQFKETFNDTNQPLKSNVEELIQRIDVIKGVASEFDQLQGEIEITVEDANLQNQFEERESFDSQYFKATATASQIVNYWRESLHCYQPSESEASSEPTNSRTVKLPDLKLPEFRGSYEDWLAFADTFTSLIHHNVSLNNIEKFYYLRSALRGDAALLIQGLEMAACNYEIAWSLLEKRYKNPKLMINNHVKAIVEFPKIHKETFKSLRNLFDGVQTHLRALKSLNEPVNSWNSLLLYILTNKLDPNTQREWEKKTLSSTEMPTIDQLTEFLESRCNLLEKIERPANLGDKRPKVTAYVSTAASNKCAVCNQKHFLYQCKEFINKTVDERFKIVNKCNVCKICLRFGHAPDKCNAGNCRVCKSRHNTLLHQDPTKDVPAKTANSDAKTTSLANVISANILLATAMIKVKVSDGSWIEARALLDSGSQSNFVTTEFAEQFDLNTNPTSHAVCGINQTQTHIKKRVNLQINSIDGKYKRNLNFLVIPMISNKLPSSTITMQLNLPPVPLADEHFMESRAVDILIGAEVYFELLKGDQIKLGKNLPTLMRTSLGWIISGPVNDQDSQRVIQNYHSTLELKIEKFWKIEELPEIKHLSAEEAKCEEHFVNSHSRDDSGRFVVKFPLKGDISELGDSKDIALKRLHSIERKFKTNETLKNHYSKFMQEYSSLGHMSRVDEDKEPPNANYLPHHAVYKTTEAGKKIRVVFDASCKTTTGKALNDIVMVGPTIQENLFDILVRFRQHQYGLTSDIVKMYRQILMDEENKELQRILWRKSPDEAVQVFKLNTVTYGTASAPFQAIRCVHQLAIENKKKFPESSNIIFRDFYVDDLISGGDDIEIVQRLKTELSEILQSGGFELDRWMSNSAALTDQPGEEELDLCKNESDHVKTLGLRWNPKLDYICYKIQFDETTAVTKRQILARTARLFDPLGLVGPIIVIAKIIMQKLWEIKADWDEPIPNHMLSEWQDFHSNLRTLHNVEIPRCIVIQNKINATLHGFADASEAAYGAVIYICSTNANGETISKLVCSKSRVAPLKKLSLPRLELCAALLLTRLQAVVINALNIQLQEVTLWSDSSIVLCWIHSEPCKLKTFVSNRIAEIQNVTNPKQWKHVSSSQNPADVLSRGTDPQSLSSNSLWWNGPSWLVSTKDTWPITKVKISPEDNLEFKPASVSMTATEHTSNQEEIFSKYSNISKLQRIVALCFRFIKNCGCKKEERATKELSVNELNNALNKLIRMAQNLKFGREISKLKNDESVHVSSSLKQLHPFLDTEGIMRVGGRLNKAPISFDQKFPIILPKNHVLTEQLLRKEHEELLHAGPSAVLASIRTKFWPVSGKSLIKKITRLCVDCAKAAPREHKHLMGDLPTLRVTPARPFTNCGIDFCGPFYTKEYRKRGKLAVKSYIAVFVCFSTRAVHLEMVTNLSANAFMGALKRFIARRGKCANIFCDNGTNFVGAHNELKELQGVLAAQKTQERVQKGLSEIGIQFHFIPPRAPHFGGLWEAAVKSAKMHLKRVAAKACLTYEEFLTLITQVESCLNSRPLTPISTDPHDLSVLTPGHFLIGDALSSIPEPDITHLHENKLSRWQRVQALFQHFWKRWSSEYLSQLQHRVKWNNSQPSLKEGDIVILKETSLPATWKMGRIVQVHPGSDGAVRVVTVKTATGEYKRASKNVCLLPVLHTQSALKLG